MTGTFVHVSGYDQTVACYGQNVNHREFYATGVFHECKNNPCRIWRPTPTAGNDNDDIDYGFYPPNLPEDERESFRSDAAEV